MALVSASSPARIDQYAVMGNPIAHSKSPQIHRLFAEQTRQSLNYQALEVPVGGLREALADFFANRGRGLNITVPFKQEAFAAVDTLSPSAQLAGAINTITRNPVSGATRGDNTDGPGLVRDLRDNHGIKLKGARLLILGAGGAVRGVIGPLLAQQPESLHIANRSVDKAEALIDVFADSATATGLSASAYASLGKHPPWDLIINGTAAGLSGELPPVPDGLLASNGSSYDMMYSDRPTAFVRWGREQGAKHALDGLGMLVEQAAESFHIWRGIRPDSAAVIRHLRP